MRALIAFPVLAVATLALCACGGKDEPSHPPPPDPVSNFTTPMSAQGADPEWSLKIRGGQLTLSRPDRTDVIATTPGPTATPHSATWTGTLPSGQTMTVSLFASACTDAHSGASLTFSAEVVLPDTAPLDGCGETAGAMPTARATKP